jgi:hypothetical protein
MQLPMQSVKLGLFYQKIVLEFEFSFLHMYVENKVNLVDAYWYIIHKINLQETLYKGFIYFWDTQY